MVGMWCSRASCWSSLSWHAVKMFCLLDKTDHVTGVTSQMGFLLNFRFQLCFSLTLGQIYFCQRISPIIYDIQQPWKKKAFLTNVQLKWDWRGKKKWTGVCESDKCVSGGWKVMNPVETGDFIIFWINALVSTFVRKTFANYYLEGTNDHNMWTVRS